MPDPLIPNLENTVARNDPGDDIASRYRFQWAWAAIACCMLMDESEDVEEVFCEHHEDVLLKHVDGSFTGHQVKTRGNDQPPWKASDEAVLTACSRFSRLESEFPGKFRQFCFLTNHPLYSEENGKDLVHILRLIKGAETITDLPGGITAWIRRVTRIAEVPESVTFIALSKTVADANLPKLRDVFMRLIETVSQCWSPAAGCSHESLRRAAQELFDECGRASSLDHYQLLPGYVVAAVNPEADTTARIDGKRMTRARIERTLEIGRNSMAPLAGDPTLWVRPGEGSTELLHKKLNAGGFSAVAITSAEDLRNKADYLGITWIQKLGRETGLKRYDHIRSLVWCDAGRAFDATQNEADGFGPTMRENLRLLLRERRAAADQLFDCTDDHLEGIAFSLTAQCKVVWSLARPWELQ